MYCQGHQANSSNFWQVLLTLDIDKSSQLTSAAFMGKRNRHVIRSLMGDKVLGGAIFFVLPMLLHQI